MALINPEIFRAYDIRGIVNETLTPEIIYQIGLAIGSEAKAFDQQEIIVARDGRLSGPVLSEALCKGLLDSGRDVIDIGMVPTPLLYFATYILSTQTGVMLTGSHNPANYNGVKMMIAGQTLAEQRIKDLYHRIVSKNLTTGKGSYKTQDIISKYIDRIASDIKLQKKLKIIIDAGNGIAGKIAPELYKTLGCEVIELFCEVDGNFPHHHPDPSVPQNLEHLISAVNLHQADIGLAFDGDGDRIGVVTDQSEIIWPDRQLMLYAIDVLKRNPGAQIIYDVKCTKHLANVIAQRNGVPLMWKTGHSLIKQKMKEIHAPLGGEMSGHIFFKERWYGFDDGLYTGARLLEIISQDSRTVSEIFQALPNSINTPELKLSVNNNQRKILLDGLKKSNAFDQAILTTIDGVRVDFPEGWGLIRGSNTTSHLTLRFEANNHQTLSDIQDLFRREILKLDNSVTLPF